MDIYITSGGEMIDAIAWRHYGHQTGTTEALLGHNPGLAAQPHMLPPGLVISLPEIAPATGTGRPVELYD